MAIMIVGIKIRNHWLNFLPLSLHVALRLINLIDHNLINFTCRNRISERSNNISCIGMTR